MLAVTPPPRPRPGAGPLDCALRSLGSIFALMRHLRSDFIVMLACAKASSMSFTTPSSRLTRTFPTGSSSVPSRFPSA